jgi:hypothetical protein
MPIACRNQATHPSNDLERSAGVPSLLGAELHRASDGRRSPFWGNRHERVMMANSEGQGKREST